MSLLFFSHVRVVLKSSHSFSSDVVLALDEDTLKRGGRPRPLDVENVVSEHSEPDPLPAVVAPQPLPARKFSLPTVFGPLQHNRARHQRGPGRPPAATSTELLSGIEWFCVCTTVCTGMVKKVRL